MIEGNIGHQGVFPVTEINFPVAADPGKLVIDPDAKPAVFPLDMILLADVGEIEVTDVIMLIKADEEFAVSNRNVSWHASFSA
jgi:hypothetical protein